LRNYLLVIAIGAILFIPFIGGVHLFDWDEINFAESAREMLVTHDFSRVQINFQPFWEKPPLFIWIQAGSMAIFGINEFAARLPNALVGIITLCVLLYTGTKWRDARFAWLWVFLYIGSLLPHFYFKSGIIDPLFNLFIFLGIFQFSRLSSRYNYRDSKRVQIAILAGLFIGLAILTKGPVAMLITLICLLVVWLRQRMISLLRINEFIIFIVVAGIVSTAWFGLETIKHGPWFLLTFIQYQVRLFSTPDAGHGGPFYYHFIVLLIGCFPASIFALGSFKQDYSESYTSRNSKIWMGTLFFVVLILFSIVKTKIVHYSSLCYFPLTYLGALYLYKLLFTSQKAFRWYQSAGILIIGSALAIVLMVVPFVDYFKDKLLPLIGDAFGKAALHSNVSWSPGLAIVGAMFMGLLITSLVFFRNSRSQSVGIALMLLSTTLCMQCVIYFFVPNIEGYSQRAAIEFFEKHRNRNQIVEVLGYKSYAQYFYTNKQQPKDTLELNTHYVLTHPMQKPAFFVSKVERADEFIRDYHLLKIGEKNGFVFLRKE
jgi:4-amino-4-deoxy-L-arabinose transferase-like glycosyltransferase